MVASGRSSYQFALPPSIRLRASLVRARRTRACPERRSGYARRTEAIRASPAGRRGSWHGFGWSGRIGSRLATEAPIDPLHVVGPFLIRGLNLTASSFVL